MKYVALFRGINVGNSIRIAREELVHFFASQGFHDVMTYINSGNVVFCSDRKLGELQTEIPEQWHKHYGMATPILILSGPQIIGIRDDIPPAWTNNDEQKTDVAYLFPEADTPDILARIIAKRDFIDIRYTPGAVIWNVTRENYHRSQISKVAGLAVYRQMTVRNVHTARKLAEMVESS